MRLHVVRSFAKRAAQFLLGLSIARLVKE
jgi:hypothetical protein